MELSALGDEATIRVFLVDDQQLVRSGFRMLIESQSDMTVVGEAGDGAQAVAMLTSGRVEADVALMDIRMPVMDGVEATRRLAATLREPGSQLKVLVLTTFDLDEYVFAALRAGASGFLLKDARPEELLSAIRAVASGDAVVAPSATKRLLEYMVQQLPEDAAGPEPLLGLLTVREREVLLEIASGATNLEIAGRLFMAEATVKTHVGHLLAKLQCRDRVALVVLAYANRLVG